MTLPASLSPRARPFFVHGVLYRTAPVPSMVASFLITTTAFLPRTKGRGDARLDFARFRMDSWHPCSAHAGAVLCRLAGAATSASSRTDVRRVS